MPSEKTDSAVFKNDYIDDIERSDNYFKPILEQSLMLIDPKSRISILDAGCGNGQFTGFLKNRINCSLYGIDGSDYALEKAKKNGFDLVKKVIDFSSSPIPFKDGLFDLVICKDVFEHLLHPKNILKEIKRVLKTKGLLLAHCPNHFPLIKRIKFIFTGRVDTFDYFPGANEWDYPHIRFFTSKGFASFFTKDGFKIREDLSFHFPSWISGLSRLPGYRVLVKRFPDLFAEGFTLLVEK